MTENVVIALIAATATVFTIIGSIVATKMTNNAQLKQQRIEAVREMKRTYYNQLVETFTDKLQYSNKPDSVEKVEANMKFMVEANRLPLYASQDMVKFINDTKVPHNTRSSAEFFNIMREDLCSNDFIEFNGLNDVSMSISNDVIVTDSQGVKQIQ